MTAVLSVPSSVSLATLADGARASDLPAGEQNRLTLSRPLELVHGGRLDDLCLDYEAVGNPAGPVVVALGGITASSHLTASTADGTPGWWQTMVGPGRAIDTDRVRVLCLRYWAGQHGTGSPDPLGTAVAIDTRDQARLLRRLLDTLGVGRVAAVVGASYGGMVGLAFAEAFPEQLDRLVVISAADRSLPHATACRILQRRAVREAQRRGEVESGMVFARALAMIGYRTPEELAERFDRAPQRLAGGFRFAVEGYLEACGESFARSFDPGAFLALSESIDLHRVDPRRVRADATLVAVRSDRLILAEQMRQLAVRLAGRCRFEEVDSQFGHDAFLKEIPTIGPIVRAALERPAGGAGGAA